VIASKHKEYIRTRPMVRLWVKAPWGKAALWESSREGLFHGAFTVARATTAWQ